MKENRGSYKIIINICGAYGTLTYNFTKYHKLATIY